MSQSVLIVEDHELISLGLKLFLTDGNSDEYQVVGTVGDGLKAINFCEHHQVDLVIMDTYMPNLNGIEASEIILSQNPDQKILVISIDESIRLVKKLFEIGVSGYVSKGASREEFLLAVKSVLETGYYLGERESKKLIDFFLRTGKKEATEHEFSERELEIIKMICNELTTLEMAEKLSVTRRTVEIYKKNIYTKIGVNSVVGIVLYAIRNGLYEVDKPERI
ncbi:response regulator transcription factor [bacterium SCSIO 12643]|nr:response regulator transcription factor [bacterium SCSIO 12643]